MISVILPLYNKEKSIKKTIECILNQTYQNFELIIINDGSTDSSYEIIKDIKSDKIRIFSKKNEGVSATRNFGVRQAKYQIIAFIDGDDLWHNDYLKILKEMVEKYPECGMYIQKQKRINSKDKFKLERNKNKLKFKNYEKTDNFEKKIFKWNYTTSSIAMKKDLFQKNNGFDITLTHGEDLDLWLRAGLQTSVCYSDNLSVITVFYDYSYNAGFSVKLESAISYKFALRKDLFLNIKSNLYVKQVLNTIILYDATDSFKTNNEDRFKFLFKFINPFYLLSIKNAMKYIFLSIIYIKKRIL